MIIENVAAVIRSVGERTEALCYQILAQQVAPEHIIVIHERPFAKALDKSFEIGLNFGLPWVLCIDADVLLRAGAVATLMSRMEDAAETVFEVQGKVLDKSYGGPMPAGNHLYRSSLLSKARQFVPFDDRSLRPETYAIKEMAKAGYPWIQTEDVLGLHGYEQYYRDIIRQTLVRSRKMARYMPVLKRFYQRLASKDNDYLVHLLAIQADFDIAPQSLLDVDVYARWVSTLMQTHDLDEKPPLDLAHFSEGFVEKELGQHKAPREYHKVVHMIRQGVVPKSRLSKLIGSGLRLLRLSRSSVSPKKKFPSLSRNSGGDSSR